MFFRKAAVCVWFLQATVYPRRKQKENNLYIYISRAKEKETLDRLCFKKKKGLYSIEDIEKRKKRFGALINHKRRIQK